MNLLGQPAYYVDGGRIVASRVISTRIEQKKSGEETVVAELESGVAMAADRVCTSVQELLVQLKRDYENESQK